MGSTTVRLRLEVDVAVHLDGIYCTANEPRNKALAHLRDLELRSQGGTVLVMEVPDHALTVVGVEEDDGADEYPEVDSPA